jgi:alpha-glucoside transport system substrate-binding protein
MTLKIHLLGPVNLIRDAQPVPLRGNQSVALLSYLVVTGRAHTRQHLIDLLFDGAGDPKANLRWVLSELRRALGSSYILADRHEVAFNFESDYWLDVAAFEAGEFELYRGDFLEGLYLRGAFQFEEWLIFEREYLRASYQRQLEQHLASLVQQEDYSAIVETAHRLLRLDNLREDWYRTLILAYARLGKRETALAQFELCRQVLRAEFNTNPSPETIALVESIQKGEIGADPRASALPFADVKAIGSSAALRVVPIASARKEGTASVLRSKQTRNGMFFGLLGVLGLVIGLIVWQSFAVLRRTDALNSSSSVGREFAGTTVTIVSARADNSAPLFKQALKPFEARTGINVIYTGVGDEFEPLVAAGVKNGSPPDIAAFPQPGYLADFVRQGQVIDLRTFMSDEYLRQQYSDKFLQLAVIDGKVAGAWHFVGVKSLVWYPKAAFEAAGYKAPETWDEMLALSDRMVSEGKTPWCISVQDGNASGWIGTDWVEDILLRTAPPETYDAWVRHELPFDSPELKRAFTIMERIWFADKYVYGGRENILAEGMLENPVHLFENPPGCYLYRQGSFAPALFPRGVEYGKDYDFFYLPPIDPQFGKPVLGGGEIFAMFNDRPEVREVMRYLTTAESVKPLVQGGGFLSAIRDTPLEWYPSAADLRYAQILLDADTYRFDGSDLMPGKVGTGTFWRGIVDWVGGKDAETVLQEIDQSWSE